MSMGNGRRFARKSGRSRGTGWLAPALVSGGSLLGLGWVLSTDPLPPTPVYYHNCDAARAAGVAPLQVREPGYRPGLDADGDGIACEPYFGG